jgi:phosphomannomutase
MNSNKLLLFDVDGTLVDSGKEIDSYMVTTLKELKNIGYHIGIAGGGSIDKILNQMKSEISFEHYFSECGCVYYKNMINDKLALEKVYEKNIRNHELYHYINILIKKSLDFLSKVEYTITGNFIDLRTGIIYISLIGMSANESEREYFKEYDKSYKIREQLLALLNQAAKSLNIEDKVSILEGGSVGIAIYPCEWDKIQVLSSLSQYKEIHFFGDKYEEGGNDYGLIHHKSVKGHKVNSKHDTYDLLKKIVNN